MLLPGLFMSFSGWKALEASTTASAWPAPPVAGGASAATKCARICLKRRLSFLWSCMAAKVTRGLKSEITTDRSSVGDSAAARAWLSCCQTGFTHSQLHLRRPYKRVVLYNVERGLQEPALCFESSKWGYE